MLTGSELLAKVKELSGASKSELVTACGYVSTLKNGKERLNFTAFYEALLEAKGLSLVPGSEGPGPGRKLSFVTTCQFNGNLLIGKAYARLAGIEPGDQFRIILGRSRNDGPASIRLIPVGDAGSGDDEQEGAAEAMPAPESPAAEIAPAPVSAAIPTERELALAA